MHSPANQNESRTALPDGGVRLFLALAVLAAWAPLCRSYIRFGDDFHFTTWLLNGGLPFYFRMHGVWRIIGHGLGNSLPLLHPVALGCVTLLTHLVCVLLFFQLGKELLGSTRLALLLSLLLGVFPWADQVLTWASAYSYLLATVFFLANLLVLHRHAKAGGSPLCAGCLCFALTLLSLLTHETLFFALSFSGLIIWFLNGRDSYREWPVIFAPSAACVVWAGLYKMFPGEMTIEHPSLNPRTLVSGIYYQYTNWEIFEPWWKAGARRLIYFDWSSGMILAAIVLVFAFVAAGWSRKQPAPDAERNPARENRLLIFCVLLLFSGIAIYAIGGGFSLDSRKKYTLIPLLLLVGGTTLRRAGLSARVGSVLNPRTLVFVGLIGIFTTWLQISLWRFEAKRMDLLAIALAAQPPNWGERIAIRWESAIQEAWPRSSQHWGVPVEDSMIRDAVELKMKLAPPAATDPAVTTLRFNPNRFVWESNDPR
jgi:hypothetical protein